MQGVEARQHPSVIAEQTADNNPASILLLRIVGQTCGFTGIPSFELTHVVANDTHSWGLECHFFFIKFLSSLFCTKDAELLQ